MTDVEREFNKLWQEDVDEYNFYQKRKNLKKDNYFKELRENKKNEPIKEMVIQIGNKDNMGRDNPETREKAKKVLLEFYKNFEKKYSDLKILGAVLHQDEATPHLHITVTPYTENHGKNGLRHKQAWDEAYKNMGFKPEHSLLNKEEKKPIVFNGWRNHVQKLLDEAMNEQGFGREDQYVTHNHMSVRDYKEWSDLKDQQEREIADYEEKIKAKSDELEDYIEANDTIINDTAIKQEEFQKLESKIENKKQEAFKNIEEDIKKEIGKNKIKQEMTPQPKPVVEEKGFGKNKKEVVDKKDYDNLEKLRKLDQQNNQHLLDQEEVYRLQLFDKDKKISELKEKDSIKKYEELEKKYKNFEEEKQVLKEELQQSKQQQQQTEQDLQKEVEKNKYLKNENEEIKEENKTLKNKLQNMSETIKSGWSKATALLELVLKNLSKLLQKFPQLHQQSEIQSIDKEFAKFENNKDVQILNRVTNNNQQQQTQTKNEDTEEQ